MIYSPELYTSKKGAVLCFFSTSWDPGADLDKLLSNKIQIKGIAHIITR
jgi:hypothetical protein